MPLEISDDKIVDVMTGIGCEIRQLNQNMSVVLKTLTQHENRLTRLEDGRGSIKDTVIVWLVKCLIGCIGVIAALTGSASIVKLLLGI